MKQIMSDRLQVCYGENGDRERGSLNTVRQENFFCFFPTLIHWHASDCKILA